MKKDNIEIEQFRKKAAAESAQRKKLEIERKKQEQQEAQARRQEQWQQLGQVLGTAATVYTAKQTQKANTARYSKPTPTPTYTPSQTSVYRPPAPTTQTNTPSYNPTPTINYSNTKNSQQTQIPSKKTVPHVSTCISTQNGVLHNNCDFRVEVYYCIINPRENRDKNGKIIYAMNALGPNIDCEKSQYVSDLIPARSKTRSIFFGEQVTWFACNTQVSKFTTANYNPSTKMLEGYCSN